MSGQLEVVNGEDWKKLLRSSVTGRWIWELSRIHGGSWVVRQQLCPHFRGFQSPQELALCPFPAGPEYSAVFLSLLKGRKSQFLQGLVLLAKRVVEGRTHRIYSECSTHTFLTHQLRNPKDCSRQGWFSDPHLGSGNQHILPQAALAISHESSCVPCVHQKSALSPRDLHKQKCEVWEEWSWCDVMLLWFAVYQGFSQKLAMVFKETAVTLF